MTRSTSREEENNLDLNYIIVAMACLGAFSWALTIEFIMLHFSRQFLDPLKNIWRPLIYLSSQKKLSQEISTAK